MQVANVVAVTRALLEESVPRHFRVEQFALKSLIDRLVDSAQANQWLDLSDQRTLAAIIRDTAGLMGLLNENSPPEHQHVHTLTSQAAELLH